MYNEDKQKSDKVGSVKKCPACGALVQNFQARCSDCGHEFSDIEASKNVEKFFEKLDEIEQQRIDISITTTDIKAKEQQFKSLDSRKEEMILNFPVPVQKSEIIEFLTNASSRMHPSTYINTFSKDTKYRNKWNKIWVKKMDQVYSKASFSMKDDKKIMEEMRLVTEKAHAVIKENNKKTLIGYAGIVGILALLIAWPIIASSVKNKKQLVIKAEVETLIEAREFEKAQSMVSTMSKKSFIADLDKKIQVEVKRHIETLIAAEKYDEAKKMVIYVKYKTGGDEETQYWKILINIQLAELSKQLEELEVLLETKEYAKLKLGLQKLQWTDFRVAWGHGANSAARETFLGKKRALNNQLPVNFRIPKEEINN